MIVFDLRCNPAGHVFEAWFGSSADYADQQQRGLVSCPICGVAKVEKAPMAPAVPRKGGGELAAGGKDAVSGGDPAKVKQMLGALAALQREMLSRSDWVGTRFADEARAIHLGDADARPIHGEASRAEVESLAEEGIEVAPLLFPVTRPEEEN